MHDKLVEEEKRNALEEEVRAKHRKAIEPEEAELGVVVPITILVDSHTGGELDVISLGTKELSDEYIDDFFEVRREGDDEFFKPKGAPTVFVEFSMDVERFPFEVYVAKEAGQSDEWGIPGYENVVAPPGVVVRVFASDFIEGIPEDICEPYIYIHSAAVPETSVPTHMRSMRLVPIGPKETLKRKGAVVHRIGEGSDANPQEVDTNEVAEVMHFGNTQDSGSDSD